MRALLSVLSFFYIVPVDVNRTGIFVQASSTRMKPVMSTPDTAVNNHLNDLKALLLILSIDLNIDCFPHNNVNTIFGSYRDTGHQ